MPQETVRTQVTLEGDIETATKFRGGAYIPRGMCANQGV